MQGKTNSGITEKARDTIARVIEHVLEEECRLSATTRDYRWSVTGPQLYSLHRLFDEQRRQLDFWLGQIIERAKAIGFGGRTSVELSASEAEREKAAIATRPPEEMLGDLLHRHEAMAQQLRDELRQVPDPAMVELLRRTAEFHETSAWMLRMVNGGSGSRVDA